MSGISKKIYLTALSVALCAISCTSAPEQPPLSLPSALGLSPPLITLNSNLGGGTFNEAVSSNFSAAGDILDIVDDFFSFMNTVSIPMSSNFVAFATAYGELKMDFQTQTSVVVDINMDGSPETVFCSRMAEPPNCAYLWLGGTPFALMVIETEAAENTGNGYVVFVPNLIGAAEEGVSIATIWLGNSDEDKGDVHFTGQAETGINADIAHFEVGITKDNNLLRESGLWAENPTTCTTTQAIFGWAENENFVSSRFDRTGCAMDTGSFCINISTANEADIPDRCTVSIIGESFLAVPSDAASARLPSTFPPQPTF